MIILIAPMLNKTLSYYGIILPINRRLSEMLKNYEEKMKIYLVADLEKLKVEGRTQISLSLKQFLEDNGYLFVENPQEADIIHFHSSGVINSFIAAKLKKKYKNKLVIYS